MKIYLALLCYILLFPNGLKAQQDVFPDGSVIPTWFEEVVATDIEKLGRNYRLTDYGVIMDSTVLQTEAIQKVIDLAYEEGGGVVIVPKGVFLSGSIFFKQGTHLHLEEGAVLKGSDDVSHFDLLDTRIEGQNLKYFAALVNADGLDGFTISGKGTLDGNGLRYWRSFWLRRAFNPECTNLDEMRPRLLFVSNSKNVQVSGIRLINSPFWTSHYYKCENVKILDLYIYAPHSPAHEKAPSSDAIDLDVCTNVLVKNCFMSVNDDAIALKGGKGPHADQDRNNGGNYNIIIEDCEFGFCHSALTCGSESVHNNNIILRRTKVSQATRLLWLKMRPDTPQVYENILLEDIHGNVSNMLYIKPWTQFFDLKGEEGIRFSSASNITLRNINLSCDIVFNTQESDQYSLSNFTLENMNIAVSELKEYNLDYIQNLKTINVKINFSEAKD
ncbi:glycoside hydrolase family 28 protein [Belliella kenyensis]|uniref:Glycoside hydrolase family 28 protein n=1 Tax=Belliella kenyensis TaxID=1472724 RepID=A0ABV8ERZ5_9BACT|nr:glycosyl hydrolase family 28 protein [Belliella kenyensis]MCH7402178.1 glycosyl hydrolase family 28 protein [Belliella kenyensis]MDN3601693.1 glycosyl hydrolase family 28 protein [Belliella kenyensis]